MIWYLKDFPCIERCLGDADLLLQVLHLSSTCDCSKGHGWGKEVWLGLSFTMAFSSCHYSSLEPANHAGRPSSSRLPQDWASTKGTLRHLLNTSPKAGPKPPYPTVPDCRIDADHVCQCYCTDTFAFLSSRNK